MKELQGPFPGVAWRERLAANVFPPVQATYSGELTASVVNSPLGAVGTPGVVKNVWMSIEECGQDDDAALMVSGEVFINGTSCVSTMPCISYVSGESSQQKTTKVTGDTGITQAVIDTDENDVLEGDIISYTFHVTRTTTPDVEMVNPIITVEIVPNI